MEGGRESERWGMEGGRRRREREGGRGRVRDEGWREGERGGRRRVREEDNKPTKCTHSCINTYTQLYTRHTHTQTCPRTGTCIQTHTHADTTDTPTY